MLTSLQWTKDWVPSMSTTQKLHCKSLYTSPPLCQAFPCCLSGLLSDGVAVQEEEGEEDGEERRNGHEELESKGHCPGLFTLRLIVPCDPEVCREMLKPRGNRIKETPLYGIMRPTLYNRQSGLE